ncbi:MarR family winged helix-turn-helix transcriptional regulator [Cognatazoarcus halotolerans]|uniref:MarR family winged helix-turn-helix transcriptional regulator n=1 Tax=Cognatazoarcus halotolerans TaxID=2686016 RepID=UPI00135BEA38|nr:MarR family transcriptional regulator [Cognatazoarcus halotolerans]MCB1898584.1 MarR family transcriptional regulator [Rhodocyclaceae bacterium]
MTHAELDTDAAGEIDAIDQETRAREDDHEALRVWLRLLTCTNLVESRLRNLLRGGFDCTLPRFDLMAQLDRNPKGLKMRELSRRLMVTGGNVTGLTDKLVAEGLVERRDDPKDRRAYSVHLTTAGKRAFRQMAKEHEAWVIELLGGLDSKETHQLLELLNRLKSHVRELDLGAP